MGKDVSGTEVTLHGSREREPRRAPFDEVERRVARESVRASLFPRFARTEQIGRYRVQRRLGEGAMGLVFAARDTQLRRDVAIKILRGDLPEAVTSDGGARLVREARALARLSHPNVVQIFDAGESDGRIYVAMELVEGGSLSRWMQEEHGLAEILDVFTQAARGLQAAHQAGLIHRDFKPGNVLVGRDGRVRVGDFGLVRRSHSKSGRTGKETTWDELTIPGTVMGTPAYMPPEQFVGGECDHRSDQFSFCVSLYEALFGERPFPGDSLEQIRKAMFGTDVKFPARAREIPEPVLSLLRRGLSALSDDRFPEMQAIVDALEAASASLSPGNAPGDEERSADHESAYASLLASLPDGAASYPEISMRARFVQRVSAMFPVDAAPPALAPTLSALAERGPEDWIPEAACRLVVAAAFDQHFHRISDWRAAVSELLRELLAEAVAGFDWSSCGDPERLTAITELWAILHRGTALTLVEHHADQPHARLRVTHPPGLMDALGRVELSELVRIGASLTCLGFAHVGELAHDERSLELELRWG